MVVLGGSKSNSQSSLKTCLQQLKRFVVHVSILKLKQVPLLNSLFSFFFFVNAITFFGDPICAFLVHFATPNGINIPTINKLFLKNKK
jgi:hypothetical protein